MASRAARRRPLAAVVELDARRAHRLGQNRARPADPAARHAQGRAKSNHGPATGKLLGQVSDARIHETAPAAGAAVADRAAGARAFPARMLRPDRRRRARARRRMRWRFIPRAISPRAPTVSRSSPQDHFAALKAGARQRPRPYRLLSFPSERRGRAVGARSGRRGGRGFPLADRGAARGGRTVDARRFRLFAAGYFPVELSAALGADLVTSSTKVAQLTVVEQHIAWR